MIKRRKYPTDHLDNSPLKNELVIFMYPKKMEWLCVYGPPTFANSGSVN